MNTGQEIDDEINCFPLSSHPELQFSKVLDILVLINKRIDQLEQTIKKTDNAT